MGFKGGSRVQLGNLIPQIRALCCKMVAKADCFFYNGQRIILNVFFSYCKYNYNKLEPSGITFLNLKECIGSCAGIPRNQTLRQSVK